MKKRAYFTREFKLEAVRLMEVSKKPASDLARELGVRRNQLYKWKDTFDKNGSDAFSGHGKRPRAETQTTERARLKRELAQSKEDVEILKKVAAFFAKELK
jgi:transposase-like protein